MTTSHETPLRTAVIGVGALGRHHARILSEMEGVDVIAVCDPNATQGAAVAEAAGTRYVADYRQVLSEVDAASVVVPTFLHRRVAEDCFAAGVHVMMEKPLAGTLDDGATIVAEARRAGLTLAVGHVERFNPAFEVLSEMVGTPRYIRAERLSPYAFRSTDISAVHDLMIHDIELVQHLVRQAGDSSNVTRVDAMGTSLVGRLPDVIQARLHFESGCVADLTANRVSPGVSRTIQVWSDAGCVTADLQAREVTAHRPGPRLLAGELPLKCQEAGEDVGSLKDAMFDSFFETVTPEVSGGDALTAELAAFRDAVVSGIRPVVSGDDGLEALGVADRVVESVQNHRWDRGGLSGPLAHPLLRPTAPLADAA